MYFGHLDLNKPNKFSLGDFNIFVHPKEMFYLRLWWQALILGAKLKIEKFSPLHQFFSVSENYFSDRIERMAFKDLWDKTTVSKKTETYLVNEF